MAGSYFEFIYETIRNYEFVDMLVSAYLDAVKPFFP
jgi:hypothetical protein